MTPRTLVSRIFLATFCAAVLGCAEAPELTYDDTFETTAEEKRAQTSAVYVYSKKSGLQTQMVKKEADVLDHDGDDIQECVDTSTNQDECMDCCDDEFPDDESTRSACYDECEDQCPEADPWGDIQDCLDTSTDVGECETCCDDSFEGGDVYHDECYDQCADQCPDEPGGDVIGVCG